MNREKLQLRPAGKGFVLAAAGNELPVMRRLVEAYIGKDNTRYIKLGEQITPLLPDHMFIEGN
jgi:2-hydroxychromene-2-carboxylate isomerase